MQLSLVLLLAALLGLAAAVPATLSSSACSSHASCVECTESKCAWSATTTSCVDVSASASPAKQLTFDDQCSPVDVQSGADDDAGFLQSWMGQLVQLSPQATLLDISLPGTHDSLSYDLSLKVSDGGIDSLNKLAALLHMSTDVIPDSLEDYMRQQGQTQALTVTQQLDAGVRFLDLRAMYEYSDGDRKKKDDARPSSSRWYSLHLLQSNGLFIDYLRQVRDWVVQHPSEVVVLWISKHGSECAVGEDQYPKTPVEEKQQFWAEISLLFKGLLLDASAGHSPHTTPISELVATGERVVIYAADWAEFTNKSPLALDSCASLTNYLGPGVANETAAVQWERELFASFGVGSPTRTAAKADNRFLLMSLSTAVPSSQMELAAVIKYVPGKNRESEKKCAEAFHIPGLASCPQTLLDVAQLENYYKQLTLNDVVAQREYGFPNAIYINAVDFAGTIRTGTQVLWGKDRSSSDAAHATSAYAYADAIIAVNVKTLCAAAAAASASAVACSALEAKLASRRAQHPFALWDDEALGRKTEWPGVIPAQTT